MALEVLIDGFDVTSISLSGSWTPKLNRPREATVRIPVALRESFMTAGSKLKIVHDGELVFHGFIQMVETSFDENVGYSQYTAQDIMELWRWRLVRDEDGDYSYPQILDTFPSGYGDLGGPIVIQQMLANSVTGQASADEDGPDGTLFLEMGDFPFGGVDMRGAPVDWPMTMLELASVLCSTGELDIVLTPIDSGGNMARVDCYHGDYGEDLSADVVFEYGSGLRNIREFQHVEDFSNVVNKLRYLLGPRKHPATDPKSYQHWGASIDGLASGSMPDPPLTDVRFRQTQISRPLYGTRMDLKIFDNRNEAQYRAMFERLWFVEAWTRAVPRTLVHITPTRDTEINTFKAGDIIGVNLYGTAFPGGLFGAQRVYGYTISWDADSVLALTDIQTSSDAEGI